ncbi:GNAT family N-acetyltransferase [Nisaea acidiphila]|uniref:GNAT family N-acetyltransferase n=1 Tax=Nisaea acidiphila TaxID=1862145 RepID=A0A9J7AVH9_9PROT|nr:GNAT family N-acetyltransferase [Nisaea acidiphila]UUX51126.1 GNAT family N-acetyltransferase [Nisaea acidiphila]
MEEKLSNQDAAKAPERIETVRLVLRRFIEADRAEMVRFYGDPEVMSIRKYGARGPEAASAAFDVLKRHWDEHGFGLYAVVEKESGGFCGECGLRYADDGDAGEIELSYGLFPTFRGKGYATEAAKAARDAAMTVLELPLLVARSRGDNTGSHKVLEKLGMTLVDRYDVPGQSHGVVKYELVRTTGS